MKWSVKIGRFVGIDVYMHFTFLLLIGWVALMHWQKRPERFSSIGRGDVYSRYFYVCGPA